MKGIIFGINGQDGFYLRNLCEQRSIECLGVARGEGNWMQGNVADFTFVQNLVQTYQPDYIFHLAANSTTRHDVLFENHETISTGTLNILESVKRHCPLCKVFITGSGVQFKNTGKAIKETDEFEANSSYSISRIHSVYAARYFRGLGIQAYVGYLFHHESPYRKDHHVSKLIANAVKRIALGSDEKINIGEISVKKEWAFAGDIVEGILALVNQNIVFEATIGTGKVYSIEEWLDTCFNLIGKKWTDYVITEKLYKPEYPILYSDPTTINSCGWFPKTEFTELAKIMIG